MLIKKALLELFTLLALFFGSWWIIARVDWVKVLQLAKISSTTEQKLGELLEDMLSSEERVTHSVITSTVDSLLTRLCSSNHVDRSTICLHVVTNGEVNAFAMPGNHLVVYTGLIKASESPEQLAGVLAHEMAHLQLGHVMKKLIKEVGLSAVMAAAGGSELIREVLKSLSSSAYERELEKEADLMAVQYLENSHIKALLSDKIKKMVGQANRMLINTISHKKIGIAGYHAELKRSGPVDFFLCLPLFCS